jgi:hypothetical protein
MKKFFALVVLLATISMTAQAQFNFGLKGGMNVSKLSLDKKVITSGNQMGFFIGPTIKFQIPAVGLGFDAAALYDQHSGILEESKFSEFQEDTKIKQQSIQIPVNIRWGFGVGPVVNLFIFAGPQFGFNVGDKEISLHKTSDASGVLYKFNSSNVSGNLGLGILLFKHLQLAVNYNMAFGETGKFVVVDGKENEAFGYNGEKNKAKMNSWQIALAYYF